MASGFPLGLQGPGPSREGAEGLRPRPAGSRQPSSVDAHDFFEILVREHMGGVRAFVLCSLRDPVTAEDLVQEAFLVAWKNLHRYDRQLPFGPWVRGIAAKLILNHRRKQARSKVLYCDEETLHLLDRNFEVFDALQGQTFDEKMNVLRDCLTRLSGSQREAIRLHYEHGLHCKEIAMRLGIGFEAVKKHLQRGRAALHRCLGRKAPTLVEDFA